MTAAVFWVSIVLIAYTYVGYAVFVAWRARGCADASAHDDFAPAMTVVIAAYNEAARIGARVQDLLRQDYPRENLHVLIVSDGSSDDTPQRAALAGDARVRVLTLAENCGKAAALNAALREVTTPFVVFGDARQRFAPQALRQLLAPFADPAVGAVSGELRIGGADRPAAEPVGLYWKFESFLRSREARLGWLHGVSGAIWAIRRELFVPLPPGTILDDMWNPLHVAFAGRRVAMAHNAIACDESSAGMGEEYRRKLRTLAGNWQLIARLPRLLVPSRNRLFFAWFSHKFLRLIAPWALLAAWSASAMLDGAVYRVAFVLQTLGYAAAGIALALPRIARRVPLLAAAGSFVMLNTAALLALPACLALDARRLWKKH